ncbi:ATP-binding protein [Herbivorax sp. ANBcel31]|uniref:AAA family ATPase n=1 Tax=Herbivorax sp. ANBcel31 TaxID=3069754 RepID=UPI0027B06503|nr:ATP-binding protein [Herbivorax sp. ANBcel31]MDQ2087918.1 ATP-binding protein [Herbivorax sp. ANBcel31]
MATAEQIKMLIQSHFDKDDDRFKTVVLQLAAYESKKGHTSLAREIRSIIDKSKSSGKVIHLNKDFGDMIASSISENRLSELVVEDDIKARVERILKEFRQQDKLKKHGMNNRRKILLAGPPGTGKTMTASILAGELHLPLCTIMVDKLVTKFMGETSAKLRQIFETIAETQAVYLFDEFDAIGSERSMDSDVGEMRRVLNSFLQFIEQDQSLSLIVAATNNLRLIDQALFRRFDDVLHYRLPKESEIEKLIKNRLSGFIDSKLELKEVVKKCIFLSHAEIARACDDAIKEAILNDKETVDKKLLYLMIAERNSVYQRGE